MCSKLELRVPPLLVLVAFAVAMWGVAKFTPTLSTSFVGRRTLAVIVAVTGLVTVVAGVQAFRRAGTTTNPINPDASTCIVRTGIYGRTRNPMYLGFLLLLAAWAIGMANAAAAFGLPLFVWYINRFQIKPEERSLRQRFGADFESYLASVRRWI